ncbi:hypothetical protein C9374_004647 [Naegleria lovaniensis]|uniref:Kinesin-like protein n=1 Tax=Naegleria lovaniensis TaxID=51637 RepID=A0AA88GSJ2_NAELO|nr:uncharacterized protein C9374_004647 [Naegleria lovaniensis]KAG2383310.1 hypothetical protein C9374_004647 [Naegleria lovaniensis]
MESITVAVRIRPPKFSEMVGSDKQRLVTSKKDSDLVEVKRATTSLTGCKRTTKDKFKFDYVYEGNTPQTQIYEDLGKVIVENAVCGVNCCLFAYGQTSSGKTHTMLGQDLFSTIETCKNKYDALKPLIFDCFKPLFFILPYDVIYSIYEMTGMDISNHGIVPRVVKELFSAIRKYHYYSVTCSFVEIYNEKITNLLEKKGSKKKYGTLYGGMYTIHNWEEARELVTIGLSNRATRATVMNDVSSRSHAVFTINVKFQPDTSSASSISATINLVDLAGSEQTGKIATSLEERKEGTSINKSLLHLGRVINKLADLSERVSKMTDKKDIEETIKSYHIPYRDSVLTSMLQGTLGGTAKTIMIATASPTEKNCPETLSTLRYASRAKIIKSSSSKNKEEGIDDKLRSLIDEAITQRYNTRKLKTYLLNRNRGDKYYVKNMVDYKDAKSLDAGKMMKITVFVETQSSMFGNEQVSKVIKRVVNDVSSLKPMSLDYEKATTKVLQLKCLNV